MKRIALSSLAIFALAALSACTTRFYGDAHFPGGAQSCFASCQSQNMEMSGFVMSGEFASSCVCRPRPAEGQPQAGAATRTSQAEADVADVSALVGVVVQQEEQENASHNQHH